MSWINFDPGSGDKIRGGYIAPALSIAVTLGWMAFIMVMLGSSDPPGPDPKPGTWWLPVLAHLFLFGVLGVLVSSSTFLVNRYRRNGINIVVVVVVGSLWGLFTELYQTTVPGRGGAVDDFVVDVIGSVLGGILVIVLVKLFLVNKQANRQMYR